MAVPTVNNVQFTISGGGGTLGTIAGYTPTAGATENSKLVVFAGLTDNDASGETITGVTYATVGVFKVNGSEADHGGATNRTNAAIFLRNDPLNAAASGDITMTTSSGTNGRSIWAATILDTEAVKNFQDLASANLDTDSTSPYPQNITTLLDDSLVLSGLHSHANTAVVLDTAGATLHTEAGGTNVRVAVGSIGVATAGVQNIQWSGGDFQQAISLVALEPVDAGGITVALDGVLASVSTQSGDLAVDRPLSGAVAASSTLSGELRVATVAALDGALAAISVLSAEFVASRQLDAALASVSALSGEITVSGEVDLVGTLSAISALSGDLEAGFGGFDSGFSEGFDGGFGINVSFDGTLAAISALSGVLSAGTITFDGALAAISDLSGGMARPEFIQTNWVDPPVAAATTWVDPL